MTRSIESLLQSRRIHQGEQFGRKARDDVTRIIRAARYSVGGDPSELTGQFDRIEDGEMVEGRNRLGDAESADSPEGYADASGADLATQHTFSEAGDRPILQLNDGWRIAHDGALQWVLQRSSVTRRTGTRRWQGRRFHAERDSLLRSVRELCGQVDPMAVETIKGWPPRYRRDCPVDGADATFQSMAAE